MAELLSVVIPLYNEEENIDSLVGRLEHLCAHMHDIELELIFVDDHSTDQTFALASKACSSWSNARLLRLAFNSGSHAAIMAGLLESSGDCALFLSGDLQDPPELIGEMIARWRNGSRIVWAARDKRTCSRPLFSRLYWQMASLLADVDLPASGVDLFLVDRLVIASLAQQAHSNVPIFLLVGRSGFRFTVVTYTREDRRAGRSGWTLKKKLALVLQTLIFSIRPVRCLAVLGALLSLSGLVVCLLVLVGTFSGLIPAEWWLVDIAAFAFLVGLQMLMTWLVGEYVNLALKETRRTPRFVVEERVSAQEFAPESVHSESGSSRQQHDPTGFDKISHSPPSLKEPALPPR